jgi:hypothetical protein
MKKRLFALVMVLTFCLSMAGTAYAEPMTQLAITPMSAVGLSSGLQKVSGSTYNVWASANPVLPENVTVGFTLNRVVGSIETYVTSAYTSGDRYYVAVQKNVSLSAGRYKLSAWYIGETESGSSVGYYTIS